MEKDGKKYETPGFPCRNKPAITVEYPSKRRQLKLKRNHARLVQSSIKLVQSWRANCDFQLLIYNNGPSHPDPTDVAVVTDYIVGYTCKGNETLIQEKSQMKQLIFGRRAIVAIKIVIVGIIIVVVNLY